MNEKESYDSKIEISDIVIPNTPPPPSKKRPKSLPKILTLLSEFYCGRPAHKFPLNFFPRSAPDISSKIVKSIFGRNIPKLHALHIYSHNTLC